MRTILHISDSIANSPIQKTTITMRGTDLARYDVVAWRCWHRSRNVGGLFEMTPTCQDHDSSTSPSPSSAGMPDDEREAKAIALASQALEFVACGRDEVSRCSCGACYIR